MSTPIIFRVLESEDFEGTLSPYILSSEIVDFMKAFYSKNEELIKMINASPNDVVRGSVSKIHNKLPYESVVTSSYTGNSNSIGDPIIVGPLPSGTVEDVDASTEILPPHTVFQKSGSSYYESNIYNPCLRDASVSKSGVFPTGDYPKEVQNYAPSIPNRENAYYCHDIGVHHKHEHGKLALKMLTSIVDSSISSIADIQIENILSALIQSRQIPLKLDIVYGLKAILKTIEKISKTDQSYLTDIYRFGLYTEQVRSISHPGARHIVRPFICISRRNTDFIKDELQSLLKSYPDDVSISILSLEQFNTIQSMYPINLDFECSVSYEYNYSEFSIVFANANKFRPDVVIGLKIPECMQQLFPGNQIAVPYGSSGKLSFILNNSDARNYDVDGIVLNGRFYSIIDLLNKDNGIREYGLAGIYATITELPTSSLIEINYVGICSNMTLELKTLYVLDRLECEIEDLDVKHELTECLVIKTLLDKPTIAIDNVTSKSSLENREEENTETTTDESSEEENPETETEERQKTYDLELYIPFTSEIRKIRKMDAIKVEKIVRYFDENGNCIGFTREDVKDKFNVLLEMTYTSLVASNIIHLSTLLQESSEYIITFGKGSLSTSLKVLTESLPATNSEDELHFAINVKDNTFLILEDGCTNEDFPEWMKPVLPSEEEPEEPGEGDTDPENPSGEEGGGEGETNPEENPSGGGEVTEPETPSEGEGESTTDPSEGSEVVDPETPSNPETDPEVPSEETKEETPEETNPEENPSKEESTETPVEDETSTDVEEGTTTEETPTEPTEEPVTE